MLDDIPDKELIISIHTLAWRVTHGHDCDNRRISNFNPHPRVEGDVSLDRQADATHDFNPHPRVEGDPISGLKCGAT